MAAMICCNSQCLTSQSDRWRNGWLLRNNDLAILCDRCGSIYEEGRFCEIFHKDVSGWRCCETCGKQVHCGCIVSVHAFSVLDAGGINCAVCARESAILTSNLRWPLQSSPGLIECFNKSCNSTSESSFPGVTQQMMDIYSKNNKFATDCNLESMSYHAGDISTMHERPFRSNERDECQNLCLCHGKSNESEKVQYEKSVFSCEEVYSCLGNPIHPSILKDRHSALHLGWNFGQWTSQAENQLEVYDMLPQLLRRRNVVTHKLDAFDGSVSSHQIQAQMIDVHGEKEFLPSYKPNASGDELQGSANSVITPLFEKMLTVTDARRVERLVLPKKCVESYFPRISHPNGLPLKFQDIEGNEWTFKFRFWSSAHGKQYFLEGMTSCVQSWQLQAGDVVTFSRIEPEGKLMMGFRKASNGPQLKQGTQVVENGHEVPSVQDFNCERHKPDEDFAFCHLKVKEAVGAGSNVPCTRQDVMLSPKRKHSWISNNVDFSELLITLEEAQGLFRSPSDHASNVEIIGDFKFEEFEGAPVIGRPTIFSKDFVGNEVRWDQCDDCLKWRKLPFNCILPARWTCPKNLQDSDRSTCDAAQELSIEELIDASKKLLDAQLDVHPEVVKPLSSSAGEDEETCRDSAQLRTKQHTSHIPDCSCVVCVKPLSGKSSQHEPGCTCKVCLYVRKQILSIICRKKSNRSEIEAETLKSSFRDKLYKRVRGIVRQMETQESNYGENVEASKTSTPIITSCRGCVKANEKVARISLEGEIDLNMKPKTDEVDSTCSREACPTLVAK